MQGLKHLGGRSYSGMDTVFLVYLQCQGPLVGLLSHGFKIEWLCGNNPFWQLFKPQLIKLHIAH